MHSLTIPIAGMSCDGCVNSVRRALSMSSGVTDAEVRVGEATVKYDPEITNPEELRSVITRAGYTPAAA